MGGENFFGDCLTHEFKTYLSALGDVWNRRGKGRHFIREIAGAAHSAPMQTIVRRPVVVSRPFAYRTS
jgi:hypothetical protein